VRHGDGNYDDHAANHAKCAMDTSLRRIGAMTSGFEELAHKKDAHQRSVSVGASFLWHSLKDSAGEVRQHQTAAGPFQHDCS